MYNFSTNILDINYLFSNDLVELPANYSENKVSLPKPFLVVLGSDWDTRFLFKTTFELWDYDVAEVQDVAQLLSLSEVKKTGFGFN